MTTEVTPDLIIFMIWTYLTCSMICAAVLSSQGLGRVKSALLGFVVPVVIVPLVALLPLLLGVLVLLPPEKRDEVIKKCL